MPTSVERAASIHTDLPVFDGHNDLAWKLRTDAAGALEVADPSSHLDGFHTDVPRLLAGGVGAQFWSVYVPCDVSEPFQMTLEQIGLVERFVARDRRLGMAGSADDVDRLVAEKRVASLLGAEGGHSIEGSIGNLNRLYERGVRYLTLTHSDTTEWADSATDERRHGGLTDLGREVVGEMNRLGMLVDISHVSAETMRGALDVSTAPVIASHSNAAALAPHPRNIPDDVLVAVGERGGVVMTVFFPGFVVRSTAEVMTGMFSEWRRIRVELEGDESAIAATMDEIESSLDVDRGTVADVVDHIEYLAEIVGVDGVGLGSDFDGMSMTPVGLEDVSAYPRITEELLERGWSESDVRKVLGENTKRVLRHAEAIAAS